ncbi:hypothetical protein [Spongiimicrobium salis]|uniref:hypothetical protein n=1 Tax=Spongiimicrobium salis TaxID=1667022 RepID=UPI00374CC640
MQLSSQKLDQEFYENLGKLFYAMAMADRRVHPKEIEKLRTFIRQYWLDIDASKDDFGESAIYQIEIVFDWLMEKEKDSSSCLKEFEEFYLAHPQKFSVHKKILILDTANAIAASFSGKNKAELILLGRLQLLFSSPKKPT